MRKDVTKRIYIILLSSLLAAPAVADSEYEEGFVTSLLNKSISRAMEKSGAAADSVPMKYGRHVTDWVSAPQFGGYIVAKYSYTDMANATASNTFDTRLVRAYVSGYVLRDFRYRIQVELRKTPAMRDYTLEWLRWKEFQVKAGQFKRCFTFENPSNPWDIGFGGYSQLAMRMCAFGAMDPSGEGAQNGRDMGLQFSGDVLPVGRDHHRLFHYKAAVFNGSGQNTPDNNNKKDWMGEVQVRPVRDLRMSLFGWKGSYKLNGVTVGRSRWCLGASYDRNDWTVRAEYAHHTGHNAALYDAELGSFTDAGRADAWYAALGIPVTPWLKTYLRYDVYRKDAAWGTARTLYTICPNIQLHKNLMFQLQYNYVCDKSNAADRHYNELWAEAYVRF